MAGKFQMRSRKWDIAVTLGSLALAVLGFGGLFLLQRAVEPGTSTLIFIVTLGIVTLAFFAGPGIVYSARKRIGPVKKSLPGGTMAWIRSHLYLPVLAITAAYIHATSAPFRGVLSSGKVTLALAVLVLISGWCRHHMIGVQKEALNVDVAISKLAAKQSRDFRGYIADYTENRRSRGDVDALVVPMSGDEQAAWTEIKSLSSRVEKHFPRKGGQTAVVRQYKVWKALHPPLTVLLFAVLGFHVWDVFGATQSVLGDEKTSFATSAECADCHTEIGEEWSRSTMSHAQDGTIMEAQLPVTIAKNIALAEDDPDVAEAVANNAKACINCHAPVGARFAEATALFPLDAKQSALDGGVAVKGGGAAIQSDGVSCIVCHTMENAPPERAGFGQLTIDAGGGGGYGTQFGPLFENAVPVRVHGIGQGNTWANTIESSKLCGACHNVKVDADGDGIGPDVNEDNQGDVTGDPDDDRDNVLDQNELDKQGEILDDLVLQTTYDEWQDYVAAYERQFSDDERTNVTKPLGCVECHMPTPSGSGTQKAVDYGPGFVPVPERTHRSHTFVGVDYDLDQKKKYKSDAVFQEVLAERKALLESSVTLEVENEGVDADGDFVANVKIRNNLLGHAFPTGFAFARQFWVEVSAETKDGKEVCLASPADGLDTPCASGVIEDDAEDLKTCDPVDVQKATGIDVKDTEIKFAARFDADDCDPWLTNFQKILTDGDPNGDEVFEEVAFQTFKGNIVRLRHRTATQQRMDPLESVRLVPDADGKLQDASEGTYPYAFDVSDVDDPDDIVVTAKLRFRHLPPHFVRSLADDQKELDRIPEEAKIDADELLENLVVTDLVSAESDDGPQLACEGPQNSEGATILDCVDEESSDEAEEDGEESAPFHGPPAPPASGLAAILPTALIERPIVLWMVTVLSLSGAAVLLRLRRRRRTAAV